MDTSTHEITYLLQQARSGNRQAADHLMERVHRELRRLAAYYMKKERSSHTLQPTALVHEAYLKLVGMSDIDFQNRTHFFALAARQMRRILVEHARNRAAVKRAGAPARITLSDADASVDPRNEDVLAVDLALDELEKQDRRAAMIVEFKFFGGLKDNEIADTLDIPFATVRRDWEFARAWLLHRLSGAKSAHATER